MDVIASPSRASLAPRGVHCCTPEVGILVSQRLTLFSVGINIDSSQLAERLAEPFCYVRVDFYDLAGKILFGELTFIPASGCYPKKAQATANETLGAKLTLPKERYILPAVR